MKIVRDAIRWRLANVANSLNSNLTLSSNVNRTRDRSVLREVHVGFRNAPQLARLFFNDLGGVFGMTYEFAESSGITSYPVFC